MSVAATQLIARSHNECCKLIEFTRLVRGQKNDFSGRDSIKAADLDHLFRNSLWEYKKTKNGHQKWIHPLTRVVVEYVDRDNDIDPGAVMAILGQVQEHINIIGNDIFQHKTGNWKGVPDLKAAAVRYEKRIRDSGG